MHQYIYILFATNSGSCPACKCPCAPEENLPKMEATPIQKSAIFYYPSNEFSLQWLVVFKKLKIFPMDEHYLPSPIYYLCIPVSWRLETAAVTVVNFLNIINPCMVIYCNMCSRHWYFTELFLILFWYLT